MSRILALGSGRRVVVAIWTGIFVSACGLGDNRHSIEGTYDVSMHFTSTTHREPCTPPQTGYCFPSDSIAFTRSAELTISNASATSGYTSFDVELVYEGRTYAAQASAVEPKPSVHASGEFAIPRIWEEGSSYWAQFHGTRSLIGLSGTVTVGASILSSSTGTFTARRR